MGKIDQAFFDEVNAAAMSQLEGLLYDWLPGGRIEGREYRAAGWHGGDGSSLAINLDTCKGGDFAGSSEEMVGDPVGVYARCFGLDRVDAARGLAGILHISGGDESHSDRPRHTPPDKEALSAKEAERNEKKRQAVKKILSEATDIKDTAAQKYLLSRGITGCDIGIFKFRPYKAGAGSLVCLAKDDAGTVQAVQQVYLTAEGQKAPDLWARADAKKTVIKRTNGFPKGNPIRIPRRADVEDDTILICEGPEDGLTLSQATGLETWVTMAIVNMDSVPLIADRKYLLVRDNDEPDSKADIEISKIIGRLIDRDFSLSCARAPEGIKDANELLQKQGIDAVREMISSAQPVIDYRDIAPETDDDYDPSQHFGWDGWDDDPIYEDDSKEAAIKACASCAHTDVGNAWRIVRRWGHNVKYADGIGWLIYNKGRWNQELGDYRVVNMAAITATDITKEQKYVDEHKKNAVRAWCKKSQDGGRINHALKIARAKLTIRASEFDDDPYLLNVANGVLDLHTGELKGHSPSLNLTKQTNVPYSPDAQCSRWEGFLREIFPKDPKLVPFIKRAVGYSLTGDTKEQCMFFLYGHGANGKSTFLDVLQDLLGDYWAKTKTDAIMDRRSGSDANPFLAMLRGARFVTASETKSGKQLDEGIVKEATGDNAIAVRQMYQKPITFQPQFKLWMATNHRPVIKGTDEGIWRRLRLIPFEARFYDPDDPDAPGMGPVKNKDLLEELKQELPGILKWAVEGCLEWQKQGLQPPDSVLEATQAYRKDMDIVGGYIEDCVVYDRNADESLAHVYIAYQQWCKENGHLPMSKRTLNQRLIERGGIEKYRSADKWVFKGIRLTNETYKVNGWPVPFERQGF